MPYRVVVLSLVLASAPAAWAQTEGSLPIVGSPAPVFVAQQWANATKPVTLMTFRGRAVLLVKWATWCPHCAEAIPKLNGFAEKFGKLGLQVVGISDEPVLKVRAYAAEKKISYLVGSGGATGYITHGIPHAWLITPKGMVAWQGFPQALKESVLERVVKFASPAPDFDLPPSLRDAQAALSAGQYTQALRLLKRTADLKGPAGEAAQEATEKVTAFGKARFERAQKYAADADYATALDILTELTRGFSGTPLANQARELSIGWRKDPKIRTETEADQMLGRAEDLIILRQTEPAAVILQQIIKTPKYAGTKARERALALLNPPPSTEPSS